MKLIKLASHFIVGSDYWVRQKSDAKSVFVGKCLPACGVDDLPAKYMQLTSKDRVLTTFDYSTILAGYDVVGPIPVTSEPDFDEYIQAYEIKERRNRRFATTVNHLSQVKRDEVIENWEKEFFPEIVDEAFYRLRTRTEFKINRALKSVFVNNTREPYGQVKGIVENLYRKALEEELSTLRHVDGISFSERKYVPYKDNVSAMLDIFQLAITAQLTGEITVILSEGDYLTAIRGGNSHWLRIKAQYSPEAKRAQFYDQSPRLRRGN